MPFGVLALALAVPAAPGRRAQTGLYAHVGLERTGFAPEALDVFADTYNAYYSQRIVEPFAYADATVTRPVFGATFRYADGLYAAFGYQYGRTTQQQTADLGGLAQQVELRVFDLKGTGATLQLSIETGMQCATDHGWTLGDTIATDAAGYGSFASEPVPVYAPALEQVYEAESFARPAKQPYKGYTGKGFVEVSKKVNTTITFNVTTPETGMYAIDFRYANGSLANRPLELRINGNLEEAAAHLFALHPVRLRAHAVIGTAAWAVAALGTAAAVDDRTRGGRRPRWPGSLRTQGDS